MKEKNDISKAFNKAAAHYEKAALAQNEIGDRLLERLDYMKVTPQWVLDLGCGTGRFSEQLQRRFPKANVVGLDLAFDMLHQSKKRQGWRRRWPLVGANMQYLPFANHQFDLVFANQSLHWSSDLKQTLLELQRIMKPEACLLFSTLGPDTFKEIRQSYAQIDNHAHVNDFIDMHDLGDALLATPFLDPVVDMEVLTLHYPSVHALLSSLKRQGVKNTNAQRNKGLSSPGQLKKFIDVFNQFKTHNGLFPLSYEVIYAHAWASPLQQKTINNETFIPVSSLKKKPIFSKK